MLVHSLLILALLTAILDWIAVSKNLRRAEYFLKPAVMILILAWLAAIGGFSGAMRWFSLGILFSLGGDIFLMLPREQFIPGLIAFLLAHIAYIIGFSPQLSEINLSSLVVGIVVAISSIVIYRRIATGLRAHGNRSLIIPVSIYVIVISLMGFSALLTLANEDWEALPALLVSAGAILFMLSDTILAMNKFVAPVKHGKLVVIIAYHLGQIGIVLGTAVHFIPGNLMG